MTHDQATTLLGQAISFRDSNAWNPLITREGIVEAVTLNCVTIQGVTYWLPQIIDAKPLSGAAPQ